MKIEKFLLPSALVGSLLCAFAFKSPSRVAGTVYASGHFDSYCVFNLTNESNCNATNHGPVCTLQGLPPGSTAYVALAPSAPNNCTITLRQP